MSLFMLFDALFQMHARAKGSFQLQRSINTYMKKKRRMIDYSGYFFLLNQKKNRERDELTPYMYIYLKEKSE